ncbi:MAG TPA: HAMP domain-containing sensor histidine kinase, partial [Polyangiaceae bacterium]
VESAWKTGGRDGAMAILTRASAREGRVHVRWVPLEGATEQLPLDAGSRARLDARLPVTRVAKSPSGEDRRYTFVRATVPDGSGGVLEVSESLAPERAYVRQTIAGTVATGLVLDVFCSGLAMLLGVWIVGRPMGALAAKARRVGQGDFGGPLHLRQKDEIASLAVEMNAMCDRLVEANERVAQEMRSRIEMLEQLRHADRLMTVGKLASGVAHEIGTPLNVVQARAVMIADGSATPGEASEYAKVIVRATERIARIIRQLLAFARRGTPQKTRCDLVTVAKHTTELLESIAAKRKVALRIVDGAVPCSVEADGGQIEQVLTNLVMNAIQASEGKSVEVRLDAVRTTPPADVGGDAAEYARVRVKDEGCGISADHLPHVFEPFFTTKDVGEGTGLGLSISYGIVREHGGWIAAASEPGRGAEFTFFLPKGAAS